MAKVPIALRLDPEALVRVDAYAAARKVSRQRVLETFVLSGLDDSSRGVVELVAPERVAKPKPAVKAALDPNADRLARHHRLAREMGWMP